MDFIREDQTNTWGSLSYTEKTRALFLQQKQTLDLFLERGAISREQYNKSLDELTKRLGVEKPE